MKTTNEIVNETLENIEAGTFRHQVLSESRLFSSNWIALGEQLTRVAKDMLFDNWGYKSFEEYCRIEVRLKKSTAIKLTNAWFFLSHEEPEIIKSVENGGKIPELEAVNILKKAKEAEGFTPEMYRNLKDSALESDKASSTLAREFKKMNDSLLPYEGNKQVDKIKRLSSNLKNELVKMSANEKLIKHVEEIESIYSGAW